MERKSKEPDIIGDLQPRPVDPDSTDVDNFGPQGGTAPALTAHDPQPKE